MYLGQTLLKGYLIGLNLADLASNKMLLHQLLLYGYLLDLKPQDTGSKNQKREKELKKIKHLLEGINSMRCGLLLPYKPNTKVLCFYNISASIDSRILPDLVVSLR